MNLVNYVCERFYKLSLFDAHVVILISHIFMNVNCLGVLAGVSIMTVNRRSSEIQGSALGKCLQARPV